MKESENRRRLLIRYLLGDLNEDEQGRIEERYFADNDFYTQLLVAEDELIDSYVLAELSRDDRERFELVYLSNPHRLKKVESSRTVLNLIAGQLPRHTSLRQRIKDSLRRVFPVIDMRLKYSFAELLLVGMLCGLLCSLVLDRVKLRGQQEQARSQWQQKESEYQRQVAALKQSTPSAPELPKTPPENPTQNDREAQDQAKEHQAKRSVSREKGALTTPLVIAFALPSGGVRTPGDSGSLKPLVIPRGSILVRLTVGLVQNEYESYNISLERPGGREIWRQTVPTSRLEGLVQPIEVEVPGALFKTGDYVMKVTGSDPSGEEEILAFDQITAINDSHGRKKTGSAP